MKNVNAKGCFIMLSRMVEARIILSNLSDEYVENPQKDFSVGMLVQGRLDLAINKCTYNANIFSHRSNGKILQGLVCRTNIRES